MGRAGGAMSKSTPTSNKHTRRGTVIVVIVVVMAILALVVAGAVRPVRDESDLATLRVETSRAFYASESGAIILMNAVLGNISMPISGSSITIDGQTIEFIQIPDDQGIAIVEGSSGDARRRIEFTTE